MAFNTDLEKCLDPGGDIIKALAIHPRPKAVSSTDAIKKLFE